MQSELSITTLDGNIFHPVMEIRLQMATSTLFTFSISPPLKFLEALFILQTTFITLSPSCTMIKSTKMITFLGIF